MAKQRIGSIVHRGTTSEVHKFFTGQFDDELRIKCISNQRAFGSPNQAEQEFEGSQKLRTFYGKIHSVLETQMGLFIKIIADNAIVKVKRFDDGRTKVTRGRCVTIIPLDLVESIYTVKVERPGESAKLGTEQAKVPEESSEENDVPEFMVGSNDEASSD